VDHVPDRVNRVRFAWWGGEEFGLLGSEYYVRLLLAGPRDGPDRVRRALRLRPVIDRGIAAGGLFTGAEGIKTAQQAAVYGGTAGVAYDHYHQLCDDLTNLNNTALNQMSDGIADATLQFALTTSAVNGTSNASDKATASTEFQGNFLRK
jgi:Zn-dependent M28 family amino/carboxypeptidase